MWDSSDQIVAERLNAFDSLEHFKDICIGTKVSLTPYSEIAYPEGWKELLVDFVESISGINCTIKTITQVYGYLDIVFITKQLSNEARIWRAVSECRKSAYTVCHLCGSTAEHRTSKGCFQLCRGCHKSAGIKGLTGTWLDKF